MRQKLRLAQANVRPSDSFLRRSERQTRKENQFTMSSNYAARCAGLQGSFVFRASAKAFLNAASSIAPVIKIVPTR